MMQSTIETNSNVQEGPEYITTIRDGAIGAGIFLATRRDGSKGHFFKLSRSYKPGESGEFKYSDQFYSRNGDVVARVAVQAAEKCDELDKSLNPKAS